MSSISSNTTNFWDRLQDIHPGADEKSIEMVFKANADALFAFQFSIPVWVVRFLSSTEIFIEEIERVDLELFFWESFFLKLIH